MTLSGTGYVIPSLEDIKAEIETELRTSVSPGIDLSSASPDGQLLDIFARQIRKVYEATAALYASMNPEGATGAQLDYLAALTGTTRRPPTASRVTATVNVDPGTYSAGTLVAHVTGNPEATFYNLEEVVNGGGVAANIDAVFASEDLGPVAAGSGTLTEISGPVSGWNSITNALDATLGTFAETDAELRARRAQEIEAPGSTTVDAIRADLIQNIDGIISASVREYQPADCEIEVVVYGPNPATAADDLAVAEQIFASKAGGIGYRDNSAEAGWTEVAITDDQNFSHTVQFVRASAVPMEASLILQYDATLYPGDAEAASQIAETAQESFRVGEDFHWSLLVDWALQVEGVLRVTAVGVELQGNPTIPYHTVPVDIYEIASLSSGDVSISSSAGVL